RGSGVSRPSSATFRHSQADPRPPTSRRSSATPRHFSATRGFPQDVVAAPTLSSLLQRNSVNGLPTALVRIDTCTPSRCIDDSLAACFRLPTTSVGDEKVCLATVGSKTDDRVRLEVIVKIEPHVRIRTPF
ncbi:hypothetical protein KR074_003346, partial [Drosophila pseudoananassae]